MYDTYIWLDNINNLKNKPKNGYFLSFQDVYISSHDLNCCSYSSCYLKYYYQLFINLFKFINLILMIYFDIIKNLVN